MAQRHISVVLSIIVSVAFCAACTTIGGPALVQPAQLKSPSISGDYVFIEPVSTSGIPQYDELNHGAFRYARWSDLDTASINAMLPITNVEYDVEQVDSSGNIKAALGAITGEAGHYTIHQSSFRYANTQAFDEKGRPVQVQIGYGFRLTANVTTFQAGIDFAQIFSAQASISAKYATGTFSVATYGMTGSPISFTDQPLNDDAIKNAVTQAQSSLKNSSATYSPMVFAERGLDTLKEQILRIDYNPADPQPNAPYPTPTLDSGTTVAYVMNSNADTVTAYKFDSSKKTLTQIGAPVPTGRNPFDLAVDQRHNTLYVVNYDDGTISSYRIDPKNGALTPIGTAQPTGKGPEHLAIDSSGDYVFVPNAGADTISSFHVDENQIVGALSAVGHPFSVGHDFNPQSKDVNGTGPDFIVTRPQSNQAYLTLQGPDAEVYALKMDSGQPSRYDIQPLWNYDHEGIPPNGTSPTGLALSATGHYLFVRAHLGPAGKHDGDQLITYAINPSNGTLSLVQHSPIGVGGVGSVIATWPPSPASADPRVAAVYVLNSDTDPKNNSLLVNSISVFQFDPQTGIPTAGPFVSATYPTPTAFAIDPSGKFLFVTIGGTVDTRDRVAVFDILPDGKIQDTGMWFHTGKTPSAIATTVIK